MTLAWSLERYSAVLGGTRRWWRLEAKGPAATSEPGELPATGPLPHGCEGGLSGVAVRASVTQ